MIKDLDLEQRSLADFMSQISERCWSAGWIENLEYVLWNALITGPMKYGQDFIRQEDIDTLKQLSQKANCWIIFDKELEEKHITLNDWQRKYQLDVGDNPELLMG